MRNINNLKFIITFSLLLLFFNADNYDQIEKFISAATEGNINILNSMLKEGFSVNSKNKQGKTALHMASYYGRIDAVKLLLKNKAEINITDKNKQTPLCYAVRTGKEKTSKLLIQHGADVKLKNSYLKTNLHWAASSGSVELINLFIGFAIDINSKDRGLNTPLHDAAVAGRNEAVKLLLKKGADPNAKTKNGYTPLDLAKNRFKVKTAEILQEAMGLYVERLEDVNLNTSLTSDNPLKDFVYVKGGYFDMGDIFGSGRDNEKPVHKVYLDDFYISKYEITRRQWTKIMGGLPSYSFYKSMEGSAGMYPANDITWLQVKEFIKKLNKLTGMQFRLPTEAEWEYAARDRGKKMKWSGTNNKSDLPDYAVLKGTGSRKEPELSGIDKIGTKKPNALGLYDMTGNVWEWIEDWYGDDYYTRSEKRNPKGPEELRMPIHLKTKVVRGASYSDTPEISLVTQRWYVAYFHSGTNIGFRLVHPVLNK